MRILITKSKSEIGVELCNFLNNFFGIIGVDDSLSSSISTLFHKNMIETLKNKIGMIIYIFNENDTTKENIKELETFIETINCKKVFFIYVTPEIINNINKNEKELYDEIDKIKCEKYKVKFGKIEMETFYKKINKLFQEIINFSRNE